MSFVLLVICSFFAKVPISVSTDAIIRPSTEVSLIRPLISGQIRKSFVQENKKVMKGETLYILESQIQDEREKFLVSRKRDAELFIQDLRRLIKGSEKKDLELGTALYRQAFFNYNDKLNEAVLRLRKVQADYERTQKLYLEKVVADAEFENSQFELDKAKNDLQLVKQAQLSTWESELKSAERELQDFESHLIQLSEEKKNLIIKAPVSGTIQNLLVAYPGSIVFANQDLAQISPDTSLIVDAFVTPGDIGLIQIGMPAKFQVTAFNYNQWGLASGKVLEVSSDIQVIDDVPVFRLRCVLNKNYLQLKNGYKGYLKKGMTVRARFMITERTLWQLLYDKVDDWLNPNNFTSR